MAISLISAMLTGHIVANVTVAQKVSIADSAAMFNAVAATDRPVRADKGLMFL